MMLDVLATGRSLSFATVMLVASILTATALAQQVPALDGGPVTELEIEQRSKLTRVSKGQPPSREEVIAELRNEKRWIREAEKFGLEIPNSEVDEVYAKIASRIRLTAEQLTQQLARSGVDVDSELFASAREGFGEVAATIVSHDAFDGNAEAPEVGDGGDQERDGAFLLLVGEDLSTRYPGMVVDSDVDEFPARTLTAAIACAA